MEIHEGGYSEVRVEMANRHYLFELQEANGSNGWKDLLVSRRRKLFQR